MAWSGLVARRLALLGLAAVLLLREVMHFSEPFLHNQIDTFLDIALAVSAVLLVANAFGFRHISWARTVSPFLLALVVVGLPSRPFYTPGYRLADWAQRSPWRGHEPSPFFIDVDPWLSLATDLLIFTTVFSVILVAVVITRDKNASHSRAI